MQDDVPSPKLAYVFSWKIENFLLNSNFCSQCIDSPIFTVKAFSDTKWFFRLYPSRDLNHIEYYLYRKNDEGPNSVTVGFDISCVTADGQVESAYSLEKCDFKKNDYKGGRATLWAWNNLLQKRSFYFPDDSFTIRCNLWTCLTEKLVSNTCTALTHIEVMKTSFKKNIYNFSAIFSSHKITFPVTFNPKLKVNIYLADIASDYVTIDISRFEGSDTSSEKILLFCKLSILDADGKMRVFTEDWHSFKPKKVDEVWKLEPFIKVQQLKEKNVLFNDTLKLHFQFSLPTGKSVTSMSCITNYEPPHNMVDGQQSSIDPIRTDLERLFVEKKFSDVKLKSGNEIFHGHKAILYAGSPVFAAMFESDMAENKSGLVDITDVDASTLNKMLFFMYSGKIEDLQEKTAISLLFAADKYQVIPLKEKCSSFLQRNIALENALQILVLADLHREEVLKISVQEFICDHKQEILSSEEWNDFIAKHISLASELVRKLSLRFI